MQHLDRQEKGSFAVDRGEALRYLGYRDQDPDAALAARIDEAIGHCELVSSPGWTYRVFDIERGDEGVVLPGTVLVLPGASIAAHLEGARMCAVLAATCGLSNEQELQRLAASGGLDAMAFDAAGSSLVEVVADGACEALGRDAADLGLYPGGRFGPGYGDLPLALQPDIVRVLDAGRRLGLSVTDAGMLVPGKSITAIVGLFDKPRDTRKSCADCVRADGCTLRERGLTCFR